MAEGMIVSDPNIMMGKPVFYGTRITVELILEKLSQGESFKQIISAHPQLTEKAILEAIAFAAKVLKYDVLYPTVG
jgi:uncharacterized protein (DUF433 family)